MDNVDYTKCNVDYCFYHFSYNSVKLELKFSEPIVRGKKHKKEKITWKKGGKDRKLTIFLLSKGPKTTLRPDKKK